MEDIASKTTSLPAVGLNHMGLCVADLDKSHAFYCNVVGMKEEAYHEVADESIERLFSNNGVSLRFWLLSIGGFQLQIVQYLHGGGSALDLQHNRRGCPHLCIEVADVRKKYDEVIARGDVKVTSDVVRQIYGDIFADTFYVTDPDGMPVEFFHKGKL